MYIEFEDLFIDGELVDKAVIHFNHIESIHYFGDELIICDRELDNNVRTVSFLFEDEKSPKKYYDKISKQLLKGLTIA